MEYGVCIVGLLILCASHSFAIGYTGAQNQGCYIDPLKWVKQKETKGRSQNEYIVEEELSLKLKLSDKAEI